MTRTNVQEHQQKQVFSAFDGQDFLGIEITLPQGCSVDFEELVPRASTPLAGSDGNEGLSAAIHQAKIKTVGRLPLNWPRLPLEFDLARAD